MSSIRIIYTEFNEGDSSLYCDDCCVCTDRTPEQNVISCLLSETIYLTHKSQLAFPEIWVG